MPDLRSAYLEMRRSGDAAFTPECLEYVFRLVHIASFRGKGFRDVSAPELSAFFRNQVEADFGSFAGETLERWGLRSGDDLGRAVFLLADHGCLALRAGETREDYAAAGLILLD